MNLTDDRVKSIKNLHHGEKEAGVYLVGGGLRARLLRLHHDEGVEEVGGDHVGDKRGGLFLKNQRHDVISDVPFPLQLKDRVMLLHAVVTAHKVYEAQQQLQSASVTLLQDKLSVSEQQSD